MPNGPRFRNTQVENTRKLQVESALYENGLLKVWLEIQGDKATPHWPYDDILIRFHRSWSLKTQQTAVYGTIVIGYLVAQFDIWLFVEQKSLTEVWMKLGLTFGFVCPLALHYISFVRWSDVGVGIGILSGSPVLSANSC